jgi:hypothetical protein
LFAKELRAHDVKTVIDVKRESKMICSLPFIGHTWGLGFRSSGVLLGLVSRSIKKRDNDLRNKLGIRQARDPENYH